MTLEKMNINAHVEVKEGSTYLVFDFDSPIDLCLTSDNNEDTKKFFIKLINKIIKLQIVPTFTLINKRDDLYNDVCVEYLKHLQNEILTVLKDLKIFDEIVSNTGDVKIEE